MGDRDGNNEPSSPHLIFVTAIITAGCVKKLSKYKVFQLEREQAALQTVCAKFLGLKLQLCKKDKYEVYSNL